MPKILKEEISARSIAVSKGFVMARPYKIAQSSPKLGWLHGGVEGSCRWQDSKMADKS